jgi:putative transposase
MIFIQSGKFEHYGYIERFIRFFGYDVLDAYLLKSILEERALTWEFMEFYTNKAPHESLGDISPREYL